MGRSLVGVGERKVGVRGMKEGVEGGRWKWGRGRRKEGIVG